MSEAVGTEIKCPNSTCVLMFGSLDVVLTSVCCTGTGEVFASIVSTVNTSSVGRRNGPVT